MSKAASVIEINGISYDTASGHAITKVKDFAKSRLSASTQVIDGFVRSRNTPETTKHKPAAKKELKKKPQSSFTKANSAKSIHSRTERSRTLVRGVVARPSLRVKQATKTLTSPLIREGLSKIDQQKEHRAKSTPKSPKVSRYGSGSTPPADVAHPAQVGEVISKPLKQDLRGQTLNADARVMPSMVTSASHQHLERLLDAALLTATSHKHAFKTKPTGVLGRITSTPRWLKLAILVITLSLVVFLFAWRNIPAVAIKVAGVNAGISANTPAYTPLGFSYAGPAESVGNTVKITYKDKLSPLNYYTVTEEKSNLNSASLASSTLGSNSQVITSQVNGNTVYIYGPSGHAAWVSEGVLYSIVNNAGLNSDQLISIVQSMQ